MKKRERALAIAVGALAAVYVGNWLFEQALTGPVRERELTIQRIRKNIASKERTLRDARRAVQQLDQWNQKSLPSDVELARSLYQQWLLELVEQVGFEQPNVDSGEVTARRGSGKDVVFRRLGTTIRGRGTLAQLTDFMYDFYRANHLHQVQRLAITPVPNTGKLDLSLSIEALVLPQADRQDRLSDQESNRLAFADRDAYVSIVQRNVFGEGGAMSFDPADFTVLTAILENDGVPEAWLRVQTTGETLKLTTGAQFEVGQFRGSIAEIEERDIVIQSDEERWLLTLGENLTQATALPPEF